MINITDKHNCVGCSACVQRCPRQCISLREDEEGFLYPHVNTTGCNDCGLCERVCPVTNQATPRSPISVIALKNPDEQIRKESSSGGVFTMLAEKVIGNGGVVFGARWNEKWEVIHDFTETKEGLAAFRGSKYVQSKIGNTFTEAERFLKAGREVLFSGTPCQIAALHLFLRKRYDNFFTIDFLCHGVPSPGVFRWYLQETLDNYAYSTRENTVSLKPLTSIPKSDVHVPDGITVQDIRFRDKRVSWEKYSFALRLAEVTAKGEKNTVSLSDILTSHPFLRGFLSNLYLRPSCHKCPAKMLKSGSDITIADCWEVNTLLPRFNDHKGVSKMYVNTELGRKYAESIEVDKAELDITLAMKNKTVHSSAVPSPMRQTFFELSEATFAERITKLCKKHKRFTLRNIIKFMLPTQLFAFINRIRYRLS